MNVLRLNLIFFISWLNFILSFSSGDGRHSPCKSIFILAGQSNMSGRGGVLNDTTTGVTTWDGVVPPECRPNAAILRLDAELRWVEAREPIHKDIDYNKTCGIGPGMPFARAVLGREPGCGSVGLVPCAIGGTSMSQWARGTPLYQQLTRRAAAAAGDGGRLKAVVWFQGESDVGSKIDAECYKERLEKLVLDLPTDLQHPVLPVMVVAIVSGPGPYLDIVREAQLGIKLPNVKVVDPMGLPLQMDNLHLTADSQVHLGEMLGNAYSKYFHPAPI